MRTPLYNDELEDFLRQQADDHRMYPSDKLWRNIQLTLHGETRWPALTYISIFIIASLVASTLLMKPEERMRKNVAVYTTASTVATDETALANRTNAAENSPVQHAYTDKITQNTIEAVTDKVNKEQLSTISKLAVENYAGKGNIALVQTKAAINPASIAAAIVKTPALTAQETAATKSSNEEIATVPNTGKPASMYFSTLGLMNLPGLKSGSLMQYSLANIDNEELWRSYPLLNANDIILKKLSKFNFQFYITPSISYRQLTDAKGKAARSYTAIPLSANYKIDINNIVKHTPSIGAEVGFALGYQLNNRFTVKSGLQFNVRQYNIAAYPAAWPPTPDEMQEGSNATTDALATSAHYTQNNADPIVLRNRYYEIAAPIGMDYKVFAGTNGTVTINVAATVQPTYTFDKEPFVITTDYKNYADGSLLMRNWNINSSVEAYISYKLGAFRWQIGPQFRYQYLPTYGGGYPIREHLLDYGIKLGFTKSLH